MARLVGELREHGELAEPEVQAKRYVACWGGTEAMLADANAALARAARAEAEVAALRRRLPLAEPLIDVTPARRARFLLDAGVAKVNLSPLDSIASGFDALVDGEASARIHDQRSEGRARRGRLYLRLARDNFHLPGLRVAKRDLHTAPSERGIGAEQLELETATCPDVPRRLSRAGGNARLVFAACYCASGNAGAQ